MSKFFNEVKQVLERSSVNHVRIVNKPNTYGYVLQENLNGPSMVYVVSSDEPDLQNQIMRCGSDDMESVDMNDQQTSPLDIVKQNAVMYLSQKGLIDESNRDKLEHLSACPCMNTVESFLRKHSLTDSEILNIVKPAIR